MFLGDSLTEWGGWEQFFPNWEINNLGRAGDTTADILNRLPDFNNADVSKLFFMAGINDIGNNTPINEIMENYKAIINHILKSVPASKVYLQSVLPVATDVWPNPNVKKDQIHQLNEKIEQLAHEKECAFINLAPAFSDNMGNLNLDFTNDGLHLSIEGYKVWKNEIKNYLSN